MVLYASQFESLVARWGEEQFDLLQPATPGPHIILSFLVIEMIKDVSTKEVALVGASSGSRTVAGGLDFAKGGVGAAGDGKDAAET